MLPAVLFDFVQIRLLQTLQPDLSRLVQLVAPAAGPKLMQPQQADLASSGPAIGAACRRLRDEWLGPGMRRLFLIDFACSLRAIERQATLAAEPRAPFSAPVALKGRRRGNNSQSDAWQARVTGATLAAKGRVAAAGALPFASLASGVELLAAVCTCSAIFF